MKPPSAVPVSLLGTDGHKPISRPQRRYLENCQSGGHIVKRITVWSGSHRNYNPDNYSWDLVGPQGTRTQLKGWSKLAVDSLVTRGLLAPDPLDTHVLRLTEAGAVMLAKTDQEGRWKEGE